MQGSNSGVPEAKPAGLSWDFVKEHIPQALPPSIDVPVLQVHKPLPTDQRKRLEQEEKRLAMELQKPYPPTNTVQQISPEVLLRTSQFVQLRLENPITIIQAIELMEATSYDYSIYHKCKLCSPVVLRGIPPHASYQCLRGVVWCTVVYCALVCYAVLCYGLV